MKRERFKPEMSALKQTKQKILWQPPNNREPGRGGVDQLVGGGGQTRLLIGSAPPKYTVGGSRTRPGTVSVYTPSPLDSLAVTVYTPSLRDSLSITVSFYNSSLLDILAAIVSAHTSYFLYSLTVAVPVYTSYLLYSLCVTDSVCTPPLRDRMSVIVSQDCCPTCESQYPT